MKTICIILSLVMELVPKGPAFLKQLHERDSILVADRLEYGFTLDSVAVGTDFRLPDFSQASNDTLTLVRNWKIDTTKVYRKENMADLRASIVVAPFEEGVHQMPPIFVLRKQGSVIDTLCFEPVEFEVKAIPIDTTTYVPHDIKGQIGYPLTFNEILPWILGLWGLVALGVVAWWLLVSRRKKNEAAAVKEPAHIVALRKLDKFRGEKYWAPEKQKIFYSGVTDALKEYIEGRFGIDAPEMTTAELFDALKDNKEITPADYDDTKALFEEADFVKFAKHTAGDEENAKVLPVAVRFVTDTYQTSLGEEAEDVL